MDGSMWCHLYIAQVLLESNYDMTPTCCMISLHSNYNWIPCHGWLKMMFPWQDELGILETPRWYETR